MRNLNLLFNKEYYSALGTPDFAGHVKKCNKDILQATFLHGTDFYDLPQQTAPHRFLMKTVYPGLLVGIGMSHSAGNANEEIALGFSFDYVTGQPYIPGSSVKGVLRSHFKDHPQAVAELFSLTAQQVRTLEREIFDGNDIFFDAVVFDGDAQGHLLGQEAITPHPSKTQEPNPISLLKILPDVHFQFRFRLSSSDLMNAQDKLSMFMQLLELFGIGAKTNTGYGILVPAQPGYQAKTRLAAVQPRPQQTEQKPDRQNSTRPAGASAPYKLVCPDCGTVNFRCKPNSAEQWPSWPNCRKCRRNLL